MDAAARQKIKDDAKAFVDAQNFTSREQLQKALDINHEQSLQLEARWHEMYQRYQQLQPKGNAMIVCVLEIYDSEQPIVRFVDLDLVDRSRPLDKEYAEAVEAALLHPDKLASMAEMNGAGYDKSNYKPWNGVGPIPRIPSTPGFVDPPQLVSAIVSLYES